MQKVLINQALSAHNVSYVKLDKKIEVFVLSDLLKIEMVDLIGKSALSMGVGGILHDKILPHLRNGTSLELDFNGIQFYSSSFFNASIGLLLKEFSIEDIQRLIKLKNMSDNGRSILNYVVHHAIHFYGTGSVE